MKMLTVNSGAVHRVIAKVSKASIGLLSRAGLSELCWDCNGLMSCLVSEAITKGRVLTANKSVYAPVRTRHILTE